MDWNEYEELMAEEGAGDPRRCPIHGTVISSPDGMFDGLCGQCEARTDPPVPGPDGEVHLILCEPGPRSKYGWFCESGGDEGTWNSGEVTCQACRAEYQRWLQACHDQDADRLALESPAADDIPF